MKKPQTRLVQANTRIFSDDLALLKKIAEERRSHWQVELRQLIHRALASEKREILMITPGKEPKT